MLTLLLSVNLAYHGYAPAAALLAALMPAALFSGWLVVCRDSLESAAKILVISFLFVVLGLLVLSGGRGVGAYVAVPAVVFVAAAVTNAQFSSYITLACLAGLVLAFWLSNSSFEFPLSYSIEDQMIGMLNVSIAVTVGMHFLMVLYRRVAERSRNEQQASARILHRSQNIGQLVGWWYDPAAHQVNYVNKGSLAMSEIDLTSSENLEERSGEFAGFWYNGAQLRSFIDRIMDRGTDWDEEILTTNSAGEEFWFRSAGEFERVDNRVQRVVGVLQDITRAKALTDQLEHQARYDGLTELLNRRSFEELLGQQFQAHSRAHSEAKNGSSSYLLYLDLDQFKIVNDVSGHQAGDALLKLVSTCFVRNVRMSDVVARLGGDEFGIILMACPASVAQSIAEKLRSEIEELQFNWQDQTYRISVSIGIVPIDATLGGLDDLQQLADAACYESKARGRNRVHFAKGTSDELTAHPGETKWVMRIHAAMENNHFELHEQRIESLGAVTETRERVEVLLRLREPGSEKLIPPGAFLPAGDRYGLSTLIDHWVVNRLVSLLDEEPALLDRRYWINLSGASVGDGRFVDSLIATLQEANLPEGTINFEITETAVIRSIGEATRLMDALRKQGCEFALDDFGSGLSSFGYLKKLPVDSVKIDGMFIRDIHNDKIDQIFVKSIIDVAHTMGIAAVAEFVENDQILQLMEELGADYVQGFGVHRPAPISTRAGRSNTSNPEIRRSSQV